MFNEEEKEILRKNLLNENEVKKIFGFFRSKLEQSERERQRLLSTYPDDHEIKTNLASLERINNGFDVVFDLLEVTMKNVIYQNQVLTSVLENVPQSQINKSIDELRKKITESGNNNTNDEFIERLKRYFEKMSETTIE